MEKEIKVYFATKLRGFFKHITANQNSKVKFIAKYNRTYEVNSKYKQLLLPIFRSNVFDQLGIIRRTECIQEEYEYIGSFNRFLKTNKPYFIYLENPTALYEYSLGRNKTFLGRKRTEKLLNDENLKTIVCMSKACEETIDKVLGPIPNRINVKTIYPYVPQNKNITPYEIKSRSYEKTIKCLFIAQGSRFISKGGKEIVEVFRDINENINLTIITNKDSIKEELLDEITKNPKINLIEFNLPYEKLEEIYGSHHILIHPTSDDSFGLTILEAIKSGLVIISTYLYAVPEMVDNGINGYLTEPKYYFFDKNNIPNPSVWNNRKSTIYSEKTDDRIKEFIKCKIQELYNDRKQLEKMSIESYKKSKNNKFNCQNIIETWSETIKNMDNTKERRS